MLVRWLKSGVLDHIPADIVDRNAPLLASHLERVHNHSGIAAYYASRKK
jgi:glutathione S-transferase